MRFPEPYPQPKKAGRKSIPEDNKLITISFGLTADELEELERYKKEEGFRSVSAAVRRMVKDILYSPARTLYRTSADEITQALLNRMNEYAKENRISDEDAEMMFEEYEKRNPIDEK